MASVSDVIGGFSLPGLTFATRSLAGGVTANAGELSGTTPIIIINNSGANPATYTTRTATQMIADSGLALNQIWWVLVVNGQATGTLTLGNGSGVTVAGTATVAAITGRLFVAQVTAVGTPAITFTGLAISFTATALAFGV